MASSDSDYDVSCLENQFCQTKWFIWFTSVLQTWVTNYSALFGKWVVQLSDTPRCIMRHTMSHLRILCQSQSCATKLPSVTSHKHILPV